MPWARSFCPFRACGAKLAKVQGYALLVNEKVQGYALLVNEKVQGYALLVNEKVQGFVLLVNEFDYFCIMISRKS